MTGVDTASPPAGGLKQKFLCYVINLDGSTQRFMKISESLGAAGICFHRLSAFDGRKRSLSRFKDYDPVAAQENSSAARLAATIATLMQRRPSFRHPNLTASSLRTMPGRIKAF